MVSKKSTEGTVEEKKWNPLDMGKKYGLILIGLLAITLVVIFGGGDTETTVEDEIVDPTKSGDMSVNGINASDTKTKTAEKDIVMVEMEDKNFPGYKMSVPKTEAETNLKVKSIGSEREFDFFSVKSEGIWIIEEPDMSSSIVKNTVVVIVKKKNIEKFFLEVDGIALKNLHMDDEGSHFSVKVDVDTSTEVRFTTSVGTEFPATDGGGFIGGSYDAETSTPRENFFLSLGTDSYHLDNIEVIYIIIQYTKHGELLN